MGTFAPAQCGLTGMVLEVVGEAEMEGHVCGQDGADDQLPDLLH